MRLLALLALAGCPDDPIIEPPPPMCLPGQVAEEGRCRFILPELPCPAHTRPALGEAECVAVGPGPCQPPFESDGSEWGCRAIAAANCPPGSAPILGSPDCRPIGWSACPDGFELDDGSCTDVVTTDLCTGAFRAALGETGCVPIGDCGAPFPPAGAILVPSDHLTIQGAIAAAPDGAIVAVESGTYSEPIVIDRPLSLIGRCAEQVIVETSTVPVVRARADASISGLTLRGGDGGVVAGAAVSLSELVIEGPSTGGVIAVAGGKVQLERSAIRTVRSNAAGDRGRGASAGQGGTIDLLEVHVADVREGAVVAVGAGSRVSIDRTVITGVRPSSRGNGGEGLISANGAVAIAMRSLIAETTSNGMLAVNSAIEASDVVVRDIRPGGGNAGIRIEDGGRFTGARLAVRRASGVAILANNPATVAELSDSVLEDTRLDSSNFAGGAFSAQSASLKLVRTRIEGTAIGATAALGGHLSLDESALFGGPQSIGAFIQASSLELSASSAIGHELAGVSVEESGTIHLDRALIRSDGEPRRLNSSGVDVHGSSEARIERSAIIGLDAQGIILLEASSATISQTLVEAVRIGPRAATGIGSLDRSRLFLDRTRVEDVDGIGVLSADGPLMVSDSAILGTREISPVTPTGLAAAGQTAISSSAFVGNAGVGVVLGGGRTTLDRVLIASTGALSDESFGHALVAESATVAVRASALIANRSVGAFFDASRAFLDTTLIAQNGVGVHVQSGSHLVEAPERELIGFEILFTSSVLFLDNQTRVGTGQLPIPDPFAGLP